MYVPFSFFSRLAFPITCVRNCTSNCTKRIFDYFYRGRRKLDEDALVVNAHLLLG